MTCTQTVFPYKSMPVVQGEGTHVKNRNEEGDKMPLQHSHRPERPETTTPVLVVIIRAVSKHYLCDFKWGVNRLCSVA